MIILRKKKTHVKNDHLYLDEESIQGGSFPFLQLLLQWEKEKKSN